MLDRRRLDMDMLDRLLAAMWSTELARRSIALPLARVGRWSTERARVRCFRFTFSAPAFSKLSLRRPLLLSCSKRSKRNLVSVVARFEPVRESWNEGFEAGGRAAFSVRRGRTFCGV